jgi:arginine:pyruvate transaminase
MRYAAITERVAGLAGAKWALYQRARALMAEGRDIIDLTIGEPDVACAPALMDVAERAMRAGRTGYSLGRGEPGLVAALARRYTARSGRMITPEQVMTLPGTQTVLFAILLSLVQEGDEVIVGDPRYPTSEAIIRATGARPVPVALRPEAGFRLRAEDVAAAVTPATRVIFLNTPHNPTGAVLRRDDLRAIGAVAQAHDLWIVSDEVYEEMVFGGVDFASPLDLPELADRVVVAASISKSHAAPGFRSGWLVGPEDFCARLLPLSETMLFGSQPFIADMTEVAISAPSQAARGMAARFAARADRVVARLDGVAGLRVHRPEAGMFALLDARAFGLSGEAFGLRLLHEAGVACMPGESFGVALAGWLRLALSRPDAEIDAACDRIAVFAQGLRKAA